MEPIERQCACDVSLTERHDVPCAMVICRRSLSVECVKLTHQSVELSWLKRQLSRNVCARVFRTVQQVRIPRLTAKTRASIF